MFLHLAEALGVSPHKLLADTLTQLRGGVITVREDVNLGDLRRMLTDRSCIIIRATREDFDMSQETLAVRLGWTRNMVANLESGRRTLTFADFVVITKAFNIEPEKLLRRILQW
jgi:ribosome-binding protein aMBF1 (putative translation factor)